jgi:hypothetical protein
LAAFAVAAVAADSSGFVLFFVESSTEQTMGNFAIYASILPVRPPSVAGLGCPKTRPVYRLSNAHMTIYQPATPETDAIFRPPCPKCGVRMLLSRIEPDKPDHDRRTFEFGGCGFEFAEVVKFK